MVRNRGRDRILLAAREELLPVGRDPSWVRLAGLPVLVPVLLLDLELFPPLVTLLLGSGIDVWPRLPVGNGEYPRTVEALPWPGTSLWLPRAFLVLPGL